MLEGEKQKEGSKVAGSVSWLISNQSERESRRVGVERFWKRTDGYRRENY